MADLSPDERKAFEAWWMTPIAPGEYLYPQLEQAYAAGIAYGTKRAARACRRAYVDESHRENWSEAAMADMLATRIEQGAP
jgi:hypothetical protein